MGALNNPEFGEKFSAAFASVQKGTGMRAILKKLKFLHRDPQWWEDCKFITDYADKRVDEALERLGKREKDLDDQSSKTRLRLADEMAKDTQDRPTLRSHIISVFSPAHDGAAIGLTNVMFHLARHPTAWGKLRAEILPSAHEPLTYDLLNTYTYLKHVLKESES